jgi:hypothetical protein
LRSESKVYFLYTFYAAHLLHCSRLAVLLNHV